MAANDYYNTTSREDHTQSPQAYHSSYGNPRDATPSLPPYTSRPPSRSHMARPQETSPVSPFEAPFDDHVYPMSHPAPVSRFDSQSTIGADSRYYGQGGGGKPQSTSSFQDDIPLRDHPGVPLPPKDNSTDHVYDAGDPSAPVRRRTNSIEQGTQARGRGMSGLLKRPKKRIAWVTYLLTTAMVAVFIGQIGRNWQLTGSPIMIKPTFNPMIGPSTYVTINMGARYTPCMHNVNGVQNPIVNATHDFSIGFPCPETTRDDLKSKTGSGCDLGDLCGFNFPSEWLPKTDGTGCLNDKPEPNQWFRFILPIFLHAGLIHIGFNMLLQMTLGREMEILIGPIRYFLVYFASGIFGFVLGGNFAAPGIASMGASGALFGVIGLTLLDLLYHWQERPSPMKELGFIMLDIVISLVLGLLPGLDNFSHIGGFLMGVVLGICILRSPAALQKRIGHDPPYKPVSQSKSDDHMTSATLKFAKAPVGFFKGRKPAWWAWWLVRAAALVFVFVVFILLLQNFYVYRNKCSWCKYISCIDIKGWCDIGNLLGNTTETATCSANSTLSGRAMFSY
ncbi:rhomboid family membrane protein-like protein [Amylocarpus encephaloides]|uniref:Rhomboid-type serine protease n=1 Tax=Amylocarpus encephaloides TaxID=45428 RepID=A0A9P7YLI0_9HELO|nr:rhomboid family membrane protein-like protein [Amylocarpus encephaloides]